MGMPYYWWGDDCDYEAYLISKKYWFIKWLVENEKIDENKIFNDCWLYYSVLMKLAIQDEPIKFLISILKNV
jgi:hypothetical protein